MSSTQRAPQGPLVGVRILDFCSVINGSFGAMLLGDMGAEVLKVESLAGDMCRQWGPFIRGESRFFQGWNRNKRSLALDLRAQEARAIVDRLVERADVVMENFRPGVTERLGIDYPRLHAIRPDLIYCSSSAFGSHGPYARRPGYDPVLQTMGGAAHLQQRFSGTVSICSVAVSDYQAAMLCVSGICAALYHRERTGEGQHLETSLLQGIMSVQSHYFARPLDCAEEGPLGIYPYRLFDTADTKIFIAAGTDKFWRLLCQVLGLPELGTHPDYDTNPRRTARAEELTARLQPIFLGRAAQDWERELIEEGVPCAAVRTPDEFFDDPQVEAMGMSQIVEHPTIGRLQVAGVPIDFGRTPGAIQRPAPRLGEHTGEVLGELGYKPERIEELVAAGIAARPKR